MAAPAHRPAASGLRQQAVDAATSLVALAGELDLAAAPELKWALIDLLESGASWLIVDLADVTFMDSTALGVLVAVKRRLGEGGTLAIARPGPAVAKLFELTGLDRSFELFDTVDAALARVRQGPDLDSGRGRRGSAGPGREGSASAARERAGGGAAIGTGMAAAGAAGYAAAGQGAGAAGDAAAGRAAAAAGDAGAGRAGPTQEAAALTGDAAMVVGIASTAMPFARSPGEQLERWLRALSRYGETGVALSALGFADDPLEPGPADDPLEPGPGRREPGPGRRDSPGAVRDPAGAGGPPPADGDVVAYVCERARSVAGGRRAARIGTTDLLAAVIDVYGDELEGVLGAHGVAHDELLERLGRTAPSAIAPPREPCDRTVT